MLSSNRKSLFFIFTFFLIALTLLSGYSSNQNLQAATGIVQSQTAEHTYSSPARSISVALPSVVTAGSLIVSAIAIDKNSGTITIPVGFTLVNNYLSGSISSAFVYKVATGGEQNLNWSYANLEEASVWVAEVSGLDTTNVLDVKVENDSGSSSVVSVSTGTTEVTSQAAEFAIAVAAVDSGNKVNEGRFWTNGFTSVAHVTDVSGSPALDVATKTLTTTGTQETTFSSTDSSDQMYAALVTFKESGGFVVGSLTATNVEPDSLSVGVTGDVVIDFTTETPLPADGKIVIEFPASLGGGFSFDEDSATAVSNIIGFDGLVAISITSNVVTLTRSGGSSSSAGVKSLTLSNIKTPNIEGSTGTYSIQTTTEGDTSIDRDLSVASDTISYMITDPSILLSDSAVSAVGTHTITLTTTKTLPSDGKIILEYPANLGSFSFSSGSATTAQSITGIDGTLSFASSSDTVTLIRSGGTSFASGEISFNLTNIENPATAGATDVFTFQTTESSDVLIDEHANVTGVSILPSLQGIGTTIGLVSDGDDNSAVNATAAMTADLNQLMSQLPTGWGLDALTWQGDIAYNGSDVPTAISAWQNSTAASAPLFFTPGNHDAETIADIEFLEAYFSNYPDYNLQGATEIPYASGTNYSYEVGDIHVSVVNQYVNDAETSNKSGSGYIEDSVFAWLKNDIRSSNKTHILITGHEPAYPRGRHIGDSLDQDVTNRDKYINLFASYGVVAHAVGHTHFPNLYEMINDQDTGGISTLKGGVWEIDTGAFGTKNGGEDPAVGYFHANSSSWGDYELRVVEGSGSPEWNSPTVTNKTHSDLERQILVNTWTDSGTGSTENGLFDMQYFIDYSPVVEIDPDWSSNNSGKWWENAFDPIAAGWTDGELAVGFDDNQEAWGWLNTEVDPDPTNSGGNQVHSIFGRVTFQAEDPTQYGNLDLEIDYDDSLLVWLNGTLVQSLTFSDPTPTTGAGGEYFGIYSSDETHGDADGKEASVPILTSYDIKNHLGALVDGTNVLTFMNTNNGNSLANSLASSDLVAGIRLSMYGENSSIMSQEHYRWRNDDGTESSATFAAAEDNALTGVVLGTQKRLRTLVSNKGTLAGASEGYILQYSESTSGPWDNVELLATCGSDPICLVGSSNIIDGSPTTNIVSGLTDEASTFVVGRTMDDSTVSSDIMLGIDEFTELEHHIMLTGNATSGSTYYLKITRAISGDLDLYNAYPALSTVSRGTVTETFQEGVNGYNGTVDTIIQSDYSSNNSNNETTLEIDSSPDWGGLIEWDLSSLNPAAIVTGSSVTLEVLNVSPDDYFMYQMLRDWTGGGATWLTSGVSPWGIAGVLDTSTDRTSTSVGAVGLPTLGTQTVSLNATGVQMVQDWIDGTDPNHGITIQNYGGSGNGVDFASSEYANVSQRPKLSVTYELNDDIAPIVTDVTSTIIDDTYTQADVIDVLVTFSENVTSTGVVTVTFDTGGLCTFIVTDAALGTCNYTVETAHTSADLSVVTVVGDITDGASNLMVNTAPLINLDDNKDIVINNIPELVHECSDGVDNDDDLLADFPNDPGCQSSTDNSEDTDEDTDEGSKRNSSRRRSLSDFSPVFRTETPTAIGQVLKVGHQTERPKNSAEIVSFLTSLGIDISPELAAIMNGLSSGESSVSDPLSSSVSERCPVFTEYYQLGQSSSEVKEIQIFLNQQVGVGLPGTSLYGPLTVAAVKKFQVQESQSILSPWGMTAPSGWWYQSTSKRANELSGCFDEEIVLDNGIVIK